MRRRDVRVVLLRVTVAEADSPALLPNSHGWVLDYIRAGSSVMYVYDGLDPFEALTPGPPVLKLETLCT